MLKEREKEYAGFIGVVVVAVCCPPSDKVRSSFGNPDKFKRVRQSRRWSSCWRLSEGALETGLSYTEPAGRNHFD